MIPSELPTRRYAYFVVASLFPVSVLWQCFDAVIMLAELWKLRQSLPSILWHGNNLDVSPRAPRRQRTCTRIHTYIARTDVHIDISHTCTYMHIACMHTYVSLTHTRIYLSRAYTHQYIAQLHT